MASTEESAAAAAPSVSPTAGFTAVNGVKEQGASTASVPSANESAPVRRGSDERLNGQPRISPPGQEKLTITTTTTHREDWPPLVNGERQAYHGYPEGEGSHKRKRSGSAELNSASSFHTHGLPSASTKQTPSTAITEPDPLREDSNQRPSQPDSRDAPSSDSHFRQYIPSPADNRDSGHPNDPWQNRHYGHSQLPSDEQIGEALQRASQNIDAQQRGQYHSPDYDPRSAHPYDEYGHDRRELSAQADPKKRKRNFSNRTKTGCMTCRRRKKKCDESKPEWYQQRGPWPKTEQKQAPIPLQSKTDYENSPYTRESSYLPQHLNGPPRREPLPGYRGQSLRVDPQHSRPINMDDEAPSASTIPSASVASPENNRLSAISYAQQTPTPVTATSSAYPGRELKNVYERIGPLHDLSRQEHRSEAEVATPQSATSNLTQILHPQLQTESPHTNPQMAAQLALSNLASTGRARTQKEEMLAGRHFFPFDKELVLERERCNGACWRFNSSTNPNNGVSPEERSRLFRDILQPRDHVISPSAASPIAPVGRVGENVIVEAPFTCDYGYNISIGQDVAIGKNCTILDTCEVTIGDRCNIGPNVNIYTTTLPIDPKRRLGSRGPNLGRRITIGDDCWIGGGVIILPGRTIGNGSTVGAGSVVTRVGFLSIDSV